MLCEPDWLNAVSPEICNFYGANPYGFEAQSRILTQRYAQRIEPINRPYKEMYFETLRELGIRHPGMELSMNDLQLLAEDETTSETAPATRRSHQRLDSDFDVEETFMPLFIVLMLYFLLFFSLHFLFVE